MDLYEKLRGLELETADRNVERANLLKSQLRRGLEASDN